MSMSMSFVRRLLTLSIYGGHRRRHMISERPMSDKHWFNWQAVLRLSPPYVQKGHRRGLGPCLPSSQLLMISRKMLMDPQASTTPGPTH